MRGDAPGRAGPLAGLKILEMVGIGPAPFCAMMLSDMGAEVVRVHPRNATSDIPFVNSKFDVLARGRRSIGIDLKNPQGKALLLDLVARADGLLEGFRPGVMERLGVGPAECLARNERLVFGRMTGWGQEGPLKDRAGHDIDYLALTGLLDAIGEKDRPPAVPLNLVGDFGGGGLLLAFGMVSAILAARESGKGQVVDAAMTDGAALLGSMIYGFRAGGGWKSERGANLLDGGAHFYATYLCADGRAVAVGAIEPKFYRIFLERLGLDAEEWGAQAETGRWPEQKARLAAIFAEKPRDHWTGLFADCDACVAPVLDLDEAMAHPQNLARGTFVEVDGVRQPAPAPRFSGTPTALPEPPSRPGADTDAVLEEWGVEAGRIVELRRSEAI
ncbi:CaiB/BaiF CoA-transferase family protein [Afifella sp. IM 167]|uniref:CaiB/BaiF CoA transferase family protein n=1 Tax=Afifella sp. IM 167 TaxID=2033586 RepID=UPI001CCBB443|nr:CaiB/BaiF CoA-transferase family protein [Afifella sp. IM 167]MBZ8134509.1 carnitine dehydratase [Afifella sp. IM 167]